MYKSNHRIVLGFMTVFTVFCISLSACTKAPEETGEASDDSEKAAVDTFEDAEPPKEGDSSDSATSSSAAEEGKPQDTAAAQAAIDVASLPKTEEGPKTVSEDFASSKDVLEATHKSEAFTMILTFYFKDGKAEGGYVTGIYSNVAQAKLVYDSYVKNEEYYANVRRSGGEITYANTDTSFEAYKGKSKDEVKQMCLDSGFEITKE